MNDLLSLLAEVGIGFAGFAAIASALGQSPSAADARLDRLRLRNLVETGVLVVVMAILPLVLLQIDAEGAWVWTGSAGLLLALICCMMLVHGQRNRAARAAELAGYSRAGALAIWTLAITSATMLILSLVAPHVLRRDFAYVSGLAFLTVMLGVYFIRIAASLLTHKLGESEQDVVL